MQTLFINVTLNRSLGIYSDRISICSKIGSGKYLNFEGILG